VIVQNVFIGQKGDLGGEERGKERKVFAVLSHRF
jgi:hypothetical protein